MSQIKDLKLNHPREWLAIPVTAYDEDVPAEGVLLAHAPERWVVMRSFLLQRGRQVVITYADEGD
ncbi:MAG: hypothetical protein EXR55_03540 [Dehalococcoidia bacterium]|nr:hypothetical protein [Dehalococcoidia bacterium]